MPTFAAQGMLTGKSAGLAGPLQFAMTQLAIRLGQPIEVVSGRRTRSEQEILYRRFLAGVGNLSAVPGTSRHESGQAADAYVGATALADVPGARAICSSLGLGFPVPGEPWHVELVAD